MLLKNKLLLQLKFSAKNEKVICTKFIESYAKVKFCLYIKITKFNANPIHYVSH